MYKPPQGKPFPKQNNLRIANAVLIHTTTGALVRYCCKQYWDLEPKIKSFFYPYMPRHVQLVGNKIFFQRSLCKILALKALLFSSVTINVLKSLGILEIILIRNFSSSSRIHLFFNPFFRLVPQTFFGTILREWDSSWYLRLFYRC